MPTAPHSFCMCKGELSGWLSKVCQLLAGCPAALQCAGCWTAIPKSRGRQVSVNSANFSCNVHCRCWQRCSPSKYRRQPWYQKHVRLASVRSCSETANNQSDLDIRAVLPRSYQTCHGQLPSPASSPEVQHAKKQTLLLPVACLWHWQGKLNKTSTAEDLTLSTAPQH